MKKAICFIITFFLTIVLYAQIEYVGKCSKSDWDSGNYSQIARQHFPRETVEKINDRSAADAYLLLIALSGKAPTVAEKNYAESLVKNFTRYTYWESIDKIDRDTLSRLNEYLERYDISEGEVYKVTVYGSYGFIVRISSGNVNNYTYSYYSYKKNVKDI